MRDLRVFLLVVLALAFSLLGIAAGWAADFSHPGVAKDADRYEAYLKANWAQTRAKPADLKTSAERSLAADPRAASRAFAGAVVLDGKDADAWNGLARALLAIKPDPNVGQERYDLPVNASGAAYRALQRARTPEQKAAALFVLGQALERRSYWRPAIEALKASLAARDDQAAREAYDRLRAQHGFRMTDYKPDVDTGTPRLCAQFSERLAGGNADLAKFVKVDGKDPTGVSVEARQLCIEGLRHGQRYEISLRAGLPSDVGETLVKPVDIAVYLPDRKPQVRFTGRNYVLPSRGQQGIPVVAINTEKIAIEVYRIGDRNLAGAVQSGELSRQLSSYDLADIRNNRGQRVWKGEMDIAPKPNEEVTAAFPVGDAVGTLKPGVYAAIARPASKTPARTDGDNGEPGENEGYGEMATQWFIVSDLGLTAFTGKDGIHALVRSLAGAEPVGGAEVKLLARNNEVLATVKSDARGYARFDAGLARGEGGQQPAVLVAENGAGEYAFLDLTQAAFDLSDRGVKGREASGSLDGYLYAERGVYRPGENVFLTALVRDAAGRAATLPVTLVVARPDGVELKRVTLADQGLGGRAETLALSDSAMTGTWRARLYADPKADPIAQLAFLVEDFQPERLELKVEAPQGGTLAPQETLKLKAEGRYLYGPPAAQLAMEGDIVVKPSAKDVPGFAGYRFGLADETVNAVRNPLEGLPQTGLDGRAEVGVLLPAIQRTARPLEADVILRLRETGGRTIERTITLPVDLRQERIGIRPHFGADGVAEDDVAKFSVVLLGADGKPQSQKGVRWELKRLETTWQWYSRDGQWSYDPVTLARKAADGVLDLDAETPAEISARVGYGRYRLEVTSRAADGPQSSVLFNAGWYAAGDNAESPEHLEVALDKQSYKPGDTAKLRIASRQGGKALVAVLGSGLHALQEVEIAKGGGEVALTVGEDWGSGAYATALLYRAMDEKAKRMPSRALGIKHVPLDQSQRTLSVGLALPAKLKPASKLVVPVKIGGLAAGEEARVTVAAVDVGILNLTRYDAPAPERWFYAQRRLGIEVRDFYGRLIDGMRAERGRIRSGGDGAGGMSMNGNPPVEELLSLYSGIVAVGADGTATAEFDLPDFNGTVRIMAVAWSKDRVGHATGDVIVRDAAALTIAAPRFLTVGDEARLDIALHNIEAPDTAFAIKLETLGGKAAGNVVARTLALKTGEKKSERLILKHTDIGMQDYAVRIEGGGVKLERKLTFEVMPPAGDVKRTTVSELKGKGGRLVLSRDLLQDLVASSARINVSVGPAARLDVPALLTQLDRYPYGCAEQTVSRALPLLYANTVAAEMGLAQDKALKDRIAGAVARVFEMQDASGAFGAWGPSSSDMWLTAYVTDFLTRAKEASFEVNAKAFGQALDRLQNFIAYAKDFEKGGEGRAYALYVLARNGRAPAGELRYYADTRLDRFSTALSKAQLGAALAMLGDKERADKVFRAASLHLAQSAKETASRADYGSHLRDGAALVTLAAETKSAAIDAPRLVDVVAEAYRNRTHTSTQEQAWLLLAARALSDQARNVSLNIDGKRVAGSVNRSFRAADVLKGDIVITNEDEAPTDAVISVIGSSLTPEPAVAKGFRIERGYYTLDGKKVDLKSAMGGASELKQNDRLVAVVKIESVEPGGRVMIVDRLPAGLEIENPRLVDSGDIKSLDWLKPTVRPEHTEFRDDRFVAAFDFFGANARQAGAPNGTANIEGDGDAEESDEAPGAPAPQQVTTGVSATVAYVVRAVTPGSFVHPAATVEDMYRPERHARTASGKLTVKEQP